MAKTEQVVMGKWGVGWSFHSLILLIIGALVISAVYLTGDRTRVLEDETRSRTSLSHCNLFSGKWVYDNKSYPHYKGQKCSFNLDEFACDKFGRKDLNYQHWRWQPHGCDLPRFDATALLEKLRGKRLVFVGDSLIRNQWVSMACLVESSIPPGLMSMSRPLNGSLFTIKTTEEYKNATIDYYWAPFLVESNCDNPNHHRVQSRIVRIQEIEKHAKYWTDADILVFDSYMWWMHDDLKVLGQEWGKEANQNCYGETEPILFQEEGYPYWGSLSDARMMHVVEATIERLKTQGLKVHFLNITQLSEYRKDAHPSIYRKQWVPLTEDQQFSNPTSYADCFHWCLPGVPDVWNEILYAYIFRH